MEEKPPVLRPLVLRPYLLAVRISAHSSSVIEDGLTRRGSDTAWCCKSTSLAAVSAVVVKVK